MDMSMDLTTSSLQNLDFDQINRFITSKLGILMSDCFNTSEFWTPK
jgi:hypothetical protein